jgi:hypothetical protein
VGRVNDHPGELPVFVVDVEPVVDELGLDAHDDAVDVVGAGEDATAFDGGVGVPQRAMRER